MTNAKRINAHFGQNATKIRYNNLCIRFGTCKVQESYPFEIYSKVEISRKARREERLSLSKLKWVLLIDSHAELFIHLIQCIRFGI